MGESEQGKVWWITGASSGIGAGLARAVADRGAALILSGRRIDALKDVAEDCVAAGAEVLVLPFEATDRAVLPGVVDRAWNWRGRVDTLVNNAGISQRSLAVDTDMGVFDRIMEVDLMAPIALTQANLPRIMAAGGGRIVAIASIAGMAPVPMRSAYCAAKHGLIGYHDVLRAENGHAGLHVLVVAPGSVKTDVSRNALNADGSARGVSDAMIDAGMPPSEAAARILDAVDAGRGELIMGSQQEERLVGLRRADPERAFATLSAMVADGYAARMVERGEA